MIWYDIANNSARWVRVGEGGAIQTNEDPSVFDNVWVDQVSGTVETLHGVAWNGTVFAAVGEAGTTLYSPDGLAPWTASASGVTGDLYGLDVGDNVFVAVGALGVILTSQDGLVWEPIDSGTFYSLWDVTVLNAEYTAVGDNDVIVVGTLVSTVLDVAIAETVSAAADQANNVIFDDVSTDSVALDELTHRATLSSNIVLAGITEHLLLEEDGETDVGGSVQTGFDETTTNLDAVVNEALLFDDVDQWRYQGDFAESFFMLVADQMAISSVQTTNQVVSNVTGTDSFTIDDRPIINNEALSDSFALSSSLSGGYGVSLTDSLAVNEALAVAMRFRPVLADSFTLDDTAAANGTLIVTTADSFAMGDAASISQIIQELLNERINFSVLLTLDGESYLGWVMNTEMLGVTNYENFRFNSMAGFGQNYYATDGEKIYLLSGSTDAGAAIDAELTTGATDFGSAFMQRIDRAYLGLRSDGNLILKVITDERVEDWYELTEVAGGLHESRIKIGKGLKARYWRFRVANKAGSTLDADSMRFIPLKLSRRV